MESIRRPGPPRSSSSRVRSGARARRVAAETQHPVRQLGCRGARAHLVHGMGRAARGVAARTRGRLPERGQRCIGLAVRRGCCAVADARDCRRRRSGARSADARSVAAAARARWSMDRGAPFRGATTRSSKIVSAAARTTPCSSIIWVCLRPTWPSMVRYARLPLGPRHPSVRGARGRSGFRYTTTLVKVLGIAALRLMEADAIPLDVQAAAADRRSTSREVEATRLEGSEAACLAEVREASA